MNRIAPFLVQSSLLVLWSATAHGQPSNASTLEAQKLYEDAAGDMEQRQYGRACPKLEAARKILPNHVRTTMTLADCYSKLGQTASAFETLESAKVLASAQKNKGKVAEIDKKLEALAPIVPKLTIVVPGKLAAAPGLSILLNGVPLPVAQWGKPMPVNPGAHKIEATALNQPPWEKSTTLRNSQSTTVEIAPSWEIRTADSSDSAASGERSRSTRRVLGFVGIGLGAVGVGAGAVLGGLAVSKNDESDDGHCDAKSVCDQIGFDLRNEARTLGNASTAAVIAGAVVLAGGVVLVLTAKSPENREKASATLHLGLNGVGIRGQW